jgi:ferredoxin
VVVRVPVELVMSLLIAMDKSGGQHNPEELQMLEMTPEKTPTSRLSCQIKASDAMDGMVVHLPEFQM